MKVCLWFSEISFLTVLIILGGCSKIAEETSSTEELFALFQNPPSEARPFVRWWWNGNCIELEELERELDVMKAAGIGGVEINPIAHPGDGEAFDYECYEWLSPEWNERVKATIEMAKERDMVVDLIMGSGWPFGGEFLDEDEFLQGVGIKKMELQGPRTLTLNLEETWQVPGQKKSSYGNPDAPDPVLYFLQMLPQGATGVEEFIGLEDQVTDAGEVTIDVPAGKHDLYIGTFQKAYRSVMHGAPGSKGPVVNHYNADNVRSYMDKLADALEPTLGGKLGDHIRALFCDSIELSGANITDDLFEEFQRRRGYDLKPYIPLVYYYPYEGYTDTLNYSEEFNSDIRRMRYDFNKTLAELFLERFTTTFDAWANEHGMQSRYQAYGQPWLVGMLDGYRLVDIPESNNWLFSPDAKNHGYWIWNKYTASGAHLSGSPVVSSEAMTNTRGVFRTTLDTIKQADDFNFISGINHSILHGYNYSPPEAGFPGWVRYGAYFSDQNTWWPYFKKWADYNARLSAVFQNSKPVVDVAILTPEADIWKQWGLYRQPFYVNPWYNHDLWEGFSRNGVMADYINEGVLQRASASEGILKSGEVTYQMVLVSGATAIEPETARAIRKLAEQGVKFLFIDRLPSETPSYFEKEKGDQAVRDAMQAIRSLKHVSRRGAPANPEAVTAWTAQVAADFEIQTPLSVDPVSEKLYQVRYRYGDSDLVFLSSQDEESTLEFAITFSDPDKAVWFWDPETGNRHLCATNGNGVLQVTLQPIQSLLLVLENRRSGDPMTIEYPDEASGRNISAEWHLEFHPISGQPFEVKADELLDFNASGDERKATFSGQVIYRTEFKLGDADWKYLDLGTDPNVTEVSLNGKPLGVKWWGRHLYSIDSGILEQGNNQLEISYTTTLANYASSLSENPVASRWVRSWNLQIPLGPTGLRNEVRLLK